MGQKQTQLRFLQIVPNPFNVGDASFISWVMREAGAGTHFRYSAAHRVYVSAAKRWGDFLRKTAKFAKLPVSPPNYPDAGMTKRR